MKIGDTVDIKYGTAVIIEILEHWIKVRVFKAYSIYDQGRVIVMEKKID